MQLLGNILIGLAAFVYVAPVQLMLAAARRASNSTGGIFGGLFAYLPLWLLLIGALEVATARGGLDWMRIPRPGQHLLVLVAGVALTVTTLCSFASLIEHPDHLPVAARPFFGWGKHVLPLLTLVFLVFALNPSLGARVPATLYRAPFAAICLASLLACVAMFGEWMNDLRKQEIARVQQKLAEEDRYARARFERVASLDTQKDFPELLGFTGHFGEPETRELAVTRAQAHPRFREALADVLKSRLPAYGLTYLDACGVSHDDQAALAGPVLEAIVELTRDAEDTVDRTHTFHAGIFDSDTRLILSVVDKFASQPVDYVTAVRNYRRAMDVERTRDVVFNARAPLDDWLASHATTVPAPAP